MGVRPAADLDGMGEDRYRAAFEFAADPHVLFDDTGILDCNAAALAMLGVTDKAAVVGRHPADLSPEFQPDGRRSGVAAAEIEAIARRVGHHRFEWVRRRADGTTLPVEVTLTPLTPDGGRAAMLSVWRDVTERAAAAAALADSERRFRGAFEQSPVGIAMLSPDGRWLKANAAMGRMLGYDPGELAGRPVVDVTHPDEVGQTRDRIARYADAAPLPGGDTFEFDKRFVHRDGRTVWTHLTVSMLRDAAGRPLHTVAHVVDVTDRRRMEQDLRASEDRLRVALEASEIGMWDWRVGTDDLHVSPTWCRMLGYDPAEVEPRVAAFDRLVHPADRDGVWRLVDAHLAGATPAFTAEMRMRHKDGRWVWVLNSGRVVERDAAGTPVRMAGTHKDVTDRKAAEAALRETTDRLRAVVAACPLAVFTVDADGRVDDWNPAAERTFGWAADTVVGRPVPVVGPDRRDEWADRVLGPVGRGESFAGLETVWRHAAGHELHVVLSAAPLTGADGRVARVLVVAATTTPAAAGPTTASAARPSSSATCWT